MRRLNLIIRGAILTMFFIAATHAQTRVTDLDSCHDDLDKLHKLASEASESADDANTKKHDLEDCRRDPETYDLLHENCRNAEGDYRSALGDLGDKMDDLDGKLRSIQDSCDYQFTVNRLTSLEAAQKRVEASKQRLCASYHRLIESGMPNTAALQLCRGQTDEQWCKQCLGLK